MHIQSSLFAIAAVLLIGLGVWLKPRPKQGALDRTLLARHLVAELELSHQTLVQQARATGSVPELLQSEMSRTRQVYIDHFGSDDPTGEAYDQIVTRWLRRRTDGSASS